MSFNSFWPDAVTTTLQRVFSCVLPDPEDAEIVETDNALEVLKEELTEGDLKQRTSL